jgi:hypothetical protein
MKYSKETASLGSGSTVGTLSIHDTAQIGRIAINSIFKKSLFIFF